MDSYNILNMKSFYLVNFRQMAVAMMKSWKQIQCSWMYATCYLYSNNT